MAVNLYKTGARIKYPDHWVPFKYLKNHSSGYKYLRLRIQHLYYLQNDGIVEDSIRYRKILKSIFYVMMKNMVETGGRVELPYFGELYIEEKQKFNSIHGWNAGKGKRKLGIVFNNVHHGEPPLTLYRAFFPNYKIGSPTSRSTLSGNSMIYRVNKARKANTKLRYLREVKK